MNSKKQVFDVVGIILKNLPDSWVNLTTHRLDIYDESQAKKQFLEKFKMLQLSGDLDTQSLESLPTAYDYIRLGHPLSSILEWVLAEINDVPVNQVIAFDSKTMPILAVARKNTLIGVSTYVYYDCDCSPLIDTPRLEKIYGFRVSSHKVAEGSSIPKHSDGTVIFVTESSYRTSLNMNPNVDMTVNIHPHFGSTMLVHSPPKDEIVAEIQHVRRRETIAMTPLNTLSILREMYSHENNSSQQPIGEHLHQVEDCIKSATGSTHVPLIASSGLSIQYALLMGCVENAVEQHPGKPIKIVLPPNCYGGTNDQARRISALIPIVDIVDLYVDSGHGLVDSLAEVLKRVAIEDGVPIVLTEIPTNPKVEVPDLSKLGETLRANRKTKEDQAAVKPVFLVDQTFCPDVKLLDSSSELEGVKTLSFSSGSKFPSGGRCTAGYCAANDAASSMLQIISKHVALSDNCATSHQLATLAKQMPSMLERIEKAYQNTKDFVAHIRNVLPNSTISFVSDTLVAQGFTPSVFSLDLPATGETPAQLEENKKLLNLMLIDHMIKELPDDCKYCVSYGQLKGSYWTIPATSTQGTTKEKDKDYVVRIALSPEVDITRLSDLFTKFCQNENLM